MRGRQNTHFISKILFLTSTNIQYLKQYPNKMLEFGLLFCLYISYLFLINIYTVIYQIIIYRKTLTSSDIS